MAQRGRASALHYSQAVSHSQRASAGSERFPFWLALSLLHGLQGSYGKLGVRLLYGLQGTQSSAMSYLPPSTAYFASSTAYFAPSSAYRALSLLYTAPGLRPPPRPARLYSPTATRLLGFYTPPRLLHAHRSLAAVRGRGHLVDEAINEVAP